MKAFFLSSVLVMTFAVLPGCTPHIQEESGIVVDFTKDSCDSIPYSLFVDSITYLDLDPEKKCLIGNIDNIAFLDSCIVLFDSRAHLVHLLDKEGRYLKKIGERGAGPGEYLSPKQMDVDYENNLILLYDPPKGKVLKYDLNNHYVGYDSIGAASDMDYLGNQKYIVTNYNDSKERAGIFLIDISLQKRNKLSDCKYDLRMNKPWEIFRKDNNPVIMSLPYEDILMEWDGEKLYSTVKFNISPSPSQQALMEMESHPQDIIKFPNRMLFLDSDRWFYSYYWINNEEIKYIFWDHKKRKLTIASSLYNDIDGIYGMELPLCINNSFVTQIEAKEENENPKLQFLHLKK